MCCWVSARDSASVQELTSQRSAERRPFSELSPSSASSFTRGSTGRPVISLALTANGAAAMRTRRLASDGSFSYASSFFGDATDVAMLPADAAASAALSPVPAAGAHTSLPSRPAGLRSPPFPSMWPWSWRRTDPHHSARRSHRAVAIHMNRTWVRHYCRPLTQTLWQGCWLWITAYLVKERYPTPRLQHRRCSGRR
jgi:hypothetical protein